MPNRLEPCLMCHGSEQLRRAGIDLSLGAPLCCAHHWRMGELVREEQQRHPDGHCTATCGCISLEELDARLLSRVAIMEHVTPSEQGQGE